MEKEKTGIKIVYFGIEDTAKAVEKLDLRLRRSKRGSIEKSGGKYTEDEEGNFILLCLGNPDFSLQQILAENLFEWVRST